MNSKTAPGSGRLSPFDLRQNWRHLKHRPVFQEPVIDGVRAIAILWVLLLHTIFFQVALFPVQAARLQQNSASALISNGTQGVDLFFTISGFLMSSILFGEIRSTGQIAISKFYVRRFLRLIPVYLLAMLLGLYFSHGLPGRDLWDHAENCWANLLYVNNFVPVAKQYMGWCWSLAIEEQFYVLLPTFIILFMGPGKGRFRILAAFLALSVIIRFAVIHATGIVPPFRFIPDTKEYFAWFDKIYDKPWMRFGGLLAGVAGGYLSTFRELQVKRFFARKITVTVLAILCIAVIAHIAYTGMGSAFFDRIPYLARELWWAFHRDALSVAAMFLILGAIHTPHLFGGWLRRFLSWKGFYPVAQLSYSFYLIHEMIFRWLFPRLAPKLSSFAGPYLTMVLDSAVGLAIASAIAVALYVAVERPCMQMRSHPATLRLIEFFSRSVPAQARSKKQPGTAPA